MAALTAAAIANWDAEMIMQMGLVNTVAGPVPLTWKANLVVGDAITITSLADHGESLLWIIAAAQSVVGIDAQQSEDSIFGILLGGPANEPGGFLHAGSSPNGVWYNKWSSANNSCNGKCAGCWWRWRWRWRLYARWTHHSTSLSVDFQHLPQSARIAARWVWWLYELV